MIMESSPYKGVFPNFLKDPSQFTPDPCHKTFGAVEQAFSESPTIHFSLSRSGCCVVDFDFKFFRDENLSTESIIMEGKASVNYTCLMSTPMVPNVNILMQIPDGTHFGKTFVFGPHSHSGIYIGNEYQGRIQRFSKCIIRHETNILDKNEKGLYTTERPGCQCPIGDCIRGCCLISPLYDQKLATLYTADEAREPTFTVWKKSNCGLCCMCHNCMGCCSGLCAKFCPDTTYYKVEKLSSNYPGGMLYVLQSALYFAIMTKL